MSDERRTRARRRMRWLGRAFQAIFTRTTVRGLEHIPAEGPLLVLFNHLSSFDGLLVVANFPHELELVGPGDFKLASLGPWVVRTYGVTLIRRGKTDRSSLKAIIAHLKAGRMLAMSPEGGTWEKRPSEVKPGAAYVSQLTQAPILPVGLGGIYGAEEAVKRFRRPRLTITFGALMPPVPPSQDRQRRDADLIAASGEIMQRLYDLQPPEDQALYDRWSRERYDLRIELRRDGEALAYDGPPLPDMSVLGEFVGKPNLFRPMWQNAGLLVEPFREAAFFAPMEVRLATRALRDALASGDYEDYLAYRLGDAKAAGALAGLEALYVLTDWAMERHVQAIRLVPVAHDPEKDG